MEDIAQNDFFKEPNQQQQSCDEITQFSCFSQEQSDQQVPYQNSSNFIFSEDSYEQKIIENPQKEIIQPQQIQIQNDSESYDEYSSECDSMAVENSYSSEQNYNKQNKIIQYNGYELVKDKNLLKIQIKRIKKERKNRQPKKQEDALKRTKQRQLKQVIYFLQYWAFYQKNYELNEEERPFDKKTSINIMGQQYYEKQLELEEKMYNQILIDNKDKRLKDKNVYADQAAYIIQVKKQTLDDYLGTIKKCCIINFPFQKSLQENWGMGQVRKYLKQYTDTNGKIPPKRFPDQQKNQEYFKIQYLLQKKLLKNLFKSY